MYFPGIVDERLLTVARERHVKCDEEKPVCRNCVKFGYECIYRLATIEVPITSLGKNELRTLQFYREQTSNDLSGCFDGTFWTRDILRLSYGSKTLEHFILALSSLDESFRLRAQPKNTEIAKHRYAFSLRQYQGAVKELMRDVEVKKDAAVLLSCCLICICMELWHGDNVMARRHAIAGLKVAEARSLSSPGDRIQTESDAMILQQLLPGLLRHCTQLGIRTNERPRAPGHTETAGHDEAVLNTRLTNFDDARSKLSKLVDLVAINVTNQQPDQDHQVQAQHLQCQFNEWYSQVRKLPTSVSTEHREARLLAVLYYVTTAQLTAIVTNDDRCYHQQTDAFQMIVVHCKQILEDNNDINVFNCTRRANDGTFVNALFLVVWRCSDPQIRRDALRLLYRSRRLEGIWSSNMVGVMAEGIMLLDEESCSDTVMDPPPKRLVLTEFEYSPGVLEKSQYDWTCWKEAPPYIELKYYDATETIPTPRKVRFSLKPYPSAGGFGMKSVFWWPNDDRFSIMNEEIQEETKCLDGAHLGFAPFFGTPNTDVQNLLHMRWWTLGFAGQ